LVLLESRLGAIRNTSRIQAPAECAAYRSRRHHVSTEGTAPQLDQAPPEPLMLVPPQTKRVWPVI
jgi:hypothetical protein